MKKQDTVGGRLEPKEKDPIERILMGAKKQDKSRAVDRMQ
jgi:hypothetical protein